jgi:hypothetical protein
MDENLSKEVSPPPALSLSLSLSLIFFSSHFFLFIFTGDETYAGWMHDEIQTTSLLLFKNVKFYKYKIFINGDETSFIIIR